MSDELRVIIEEAPKGKRWVAIAGDWPGLERNGKSEAEAVAKLESYISRYMSVAKRARLGAELEKQAKLKVVARHTGTGSTDFWGISFAPSDEDREAISDAEFERRIQLLRAAWGEFDEVAARVSEDLRPGVRGGGRSRDKIIRHVLVVEGEDFAKRVDALTDFEDPTSRTPGHRAFHRDRFVEAMRQWRANDKPLGKWTVLYLLRHSAYHVLDHTWEMEDRDLSGDG
jgi:predicted RNase H-like HicB family nuclease